jgi:DNA-binding transcriptional ArsR family regulator
LSLRHAADLLQALAHPIRLQILELLRRRPATVTAVVDDLGLEQPIVSRHLGVLRDAGLVTARTQGRERVYQLAGCHAEPLLEVLFQPTPNPARTRRGEVA